jgi:hypothetical protein
MFLLSLCRTTLIVLKSGWSTPASISRCVCYGIVFERITLFHVYSS